jgi:hypothetical protein
MAVASVTATLLTSILGSPEVRKMFRAVADQRIAQKAALVNSNSEDGKQQQENELQELQKAGLIGLAQETGKYYVTAMGLKVARDLESLPIS